MPWGPSLRPAGQQQQRKPKTQKNEHHQSFRDSPIPRKVLATFYHYAYLYSSYFAIGSRFWFLFCFVFMLRLYCLRQRISPEWENEQQNCVQNASYDLCIEPAKKKIKRTSKKSLLERDTYSANKKRRMRVDASQLKSVLWKVLITREPERLWY